MEIEDYLNKLPKYNTTIGLDRTRDEISRLSLTKLNYDYIHIAGTKGKGSTAVMIASILVKSGLKVGLFISPHLINIKERISVNLKEIDSESFKECFDKVSKSLNFFETLFIISLLYFEKEKIDIAIFETGLGGRLDPTNSMLKSPLVSVLTTIGMDHLDILGDTIEKITQEKVEIIKRDVPVITAPQRDEVMNIIINKAKQMDSLVYNIDLDYELITMEIDDLEKEVFNLYSKVTGNLYENLQIKLLGKHQLVNANLAVCASEILNTLGYDIKDNEIRDGLFDAYIPGRFQIMYIDDRIIVLDGAHNPESGLCLYYALNNKFHGKKVIYLFTTLKNKQTKEIISNLLPNSNLFIFTTLKEPETLTTAELKGILLKIDSKIELIEIEDPYLAFKTALEISNKNDVICITGSLYLVGKMLEYLKCK